MNDLISRQDAIGAIVNTPTDVYSHDRIVSVLDGAAFRQNEIIDIINALPSAQQELLDDGTLMMTVPHGMLNDVKRVLVDEVGTKFCKTMYQDEPERKKGEWVETEFLKLMECSCCHVRWGMYDVENFKFCPNCGSYNGGEEECMKVQ